MKSSDVDSLYNEIRKILIFSNFAEQEGKKGLKLRKKLFPSNNVL